MNKLSIIRAVMITSLFGSGSLTAAPMAPPAAPGKPPANNYMGASFAKPGDEFCQDYTKLSDRQLPLEAVFRGTVE
ncbi:MAG: hypothetical protein R3E95_06905 [Thiolinea sp.]